MARKNGITHKQLPRTENCANELHIPLKTSEDASFFSQVDEFVGADGKYTPFVKYIELKLHDERLEGMEVVDTPGLNDPVSSRVDVTNRFLRECDAVLLLSGVSHFLDANDADLAGRQIREASIKRAYIVGTMVDLGLLECPVRNLNLEDAYGVCRDNYQGMAEAFCKNLIKQTGELPEGMDAEDGPALVSSMLYAIARKKRDAKPFNVEEQHLLNRLAKTFPGYERILETAADFEDISGFADVTENVYIPVRKDKEKILQERIANFETEQRGIICRLLEDMAISSDRRRELLENSDVAELNERAKTMQNNLQNSRMAVRNIFDDMKLNSKKAVNTLKVNMRQAMSNRDFTNFNIDNEVEPETWSTGCFFKDYHSRVYTVRKASATQVTDNIERYGQESMRMINECLGDIFNRERLADKLRDAIYDAFQSVDENSSKADILGPVNALLDEIGQPVIDYTGPEEAKSRIFNQFSSEVTDSDIEKLRMAQSTQLEAVYNNYAAKVDKALETIVSALDKSGSTFVDKVCDKVNAAYATIQDQLKDKASNVAKYQAFSKEIKALKQQMAEN